jgi:hypothetical protein
MPTLLEPDSIMKNKMKTSKFPLIEIRGNFYSSAEEVKNRIQFLENECDRLRTELRQEPTIAQAESTEPKAILGRVTDNENIRIYLVWGIGTYPNGIKMLDLRAVTTSAGKAKLYSRMMRADKIYFHDKFERVVIEERVTNHLYGEYLREWDLNIGLF